MPCTWRGTIGYPVSSQWGCFFSWASSTLSAWSPLLPPRSILGSSPPGPCIASSLLRLSLILCLQPSIRYRFSSLTSHHMQSFLFFSFFHLLIYYHHLFILEDYKFLQSLVLAVGVSLFLMVFWLEQEISRLV